MTTATSNTSAPEHTQSVTGPHQHWSQHDEAHEDVSETSASTESSSDSYSSGVSGHRGSLMWRIRTMDGREFEVPAVTVMINEPDENAIDHAIE